MNSNERFDIFKEITRKIVMRLAEGDIPWRKRWCSPVNKKINYASRREYNGINLLLLDKPGEYMTFNQCSKEGGKILKGEKATIIFKWIPYIPKSKKEEAEKLEKEGKSIDHLIRFLSSSDRVFHISQTEGVKSKIETSDHKSAGNPTDMADFVISQYCDLYGMKIVETQTDYVHTDPDRKSITIPSRTQFRNEEQWYNTLFGAMVRNMIQDSDRDEEDSNTNPIKNELAAEIGASMILSGVELEMKETTQDTLAECSRWMTELNKDYRLIVSASNKAEKAARKILAPIIS